MRLYYRIKNFFVYGWDNFRGRCQRFKRGWSYGDARDIDVWFMQTVKPMLVFLRDNGWGVPNDLYVDGENERINWENILTEMINYITLMNEDEVRNHLGIADDDCSIESYNRVNDFMYEKKDRFFELFSKHFYSLWD